MKEYAKKALIYILVFAGAYALMLGFLVFSAGVKTENIQEKMQESADYLCEDIVFPYMEKDINPSCIDRYADSPNLRYAISAAPPPWAPARLLPNTNTSFFSRCVILSGVTLAIPIIYIILIHRCKDSTIRE